MKRSHTRLLLAALIAMAGIAPDHVLSSPAARLDQITRLSDHSTTRLLNYSPTRQPVYPTISLHVLAATEGGASASFLVVLREQADLSRAALLTTKVDKGRFVYEALRQTALRTQAPLRAEFDRAGVRYRSFYIVNMMEVTGDRHLALELAARSDVARIEANPQISNIQYPISNVKSDIRHLILDIGYSIEWNIQKVNAPAVWAMGYTGQGVVVAGQDTGYQWDHPALRPHYRGWNGVTATHDYSWHDAIHDSVGNPCGNDLPSPCDDHGHGTHTMGIMVGDDGAGNQVGMAPGARWIGCRNMDRGVGTPARYIECFEFFLAPYPVGGSALIEGDPSRAPDVIGNSWSCPTYEGCDPLTLQAVVDNVRAAGVEVVAAAQNYGTGCGTVREPIGIYANVFTAGATNSTDAIADLSSRGPVTSDGSGRRKPDISAPGIGIRSTYPTNSWSSLSGTSMATPHVAGLFALVWSAAPGLIGDLAATENVITHTAVHLTTTQGCGGDLPTSVPNNVYGWGRIDALAATQVVSAWPSLRIAISAPAGPVLPGSMLTYTLVVANPSQLSANSNVTVTDQLPPSASFASASSGGVYSPTTQVVTWLVPMLAAQTSITFTLGVTVSNVPSGTLITNNDYGARSDQVAHFVGGPPVVTTVQAMQPALLITATAPGGPVFPASLLTYTFVVANPSPLLANSGVIVTDTLPLSVTFAGASDDGVYSLTTRMVTWLVPMLTAQTSITLTLGVTVGSAPSGTLIVNDDYGVRSNQVVNVVGGPAVTTTVGAFPYIYYLPILTLSAPLR